MDMPLEQNIPPPKSKGGRPRATEQTKDKAISILQNIKERLRTGEHSVGLSKNERCNVNRQLEFFNYNAENDKLYKKHKKDPSRWVEVIFCAEKKQRVFEEAHAGHVGEGATMDNISRGFFWKNMVTEVRDLVNACEGCLKQRKLKTQAPELHPIVTTEPWHKVGIDLIGKLPATPGGYEYVLSVTCLFSKWVELYPLKRKSGPDVAVRLEQFILRHGAPRAFLSDQGREFNNEVNQSLFERYGVRHMVTKAYHPQTNGQAESTNKILKDRLRKMVNDQQDDWDTFLDVVAHSMNHTARRSTKVSAYFILYGVHPRTVQQMEPCTDDETLEISCHELSDAEIKEYMEKRISERKDLHTKIKASLEASQAKQKSDYRKNANRNVKVFDLSIGDIVKKRNARKHTRMGDTLTSEWIGKYQIKDINHDTNSVKLYDLQRKEELKRQVPYDQLMPFPTDQVCLAGTTEKKEKSDQTHDFAEDIPLSSRSTDEPSMEQNMNRDPDCVITNMTPSVPRTSPKPVVTMRPPARSDNFFEILSSGRWLTDEHIDTAQYLLALQFIHRGIAIQPCTVLEAGTGGANVGTPEGKFVQIMLVHNSHWIVVSNIQNDDGAVTIYDSMGPSELSEDCKRAIAWLMFSQKDAITVRWADVAKQSGSNDCGLFAIANATALCFGQDATKAAYRQELMRSHVRECIRKQSMEEFPKRSYRKRSRDVQVSTIELVCTCRQPATWDASIVCIQCGKRYHPECVNFIIGEYICC